MASLGGNEEGRAVLMDLENEGVITQYCRIWNDAGVPSAWVLHSGSSPHPQLDACTRIDPRFTQRRTTRRRS